MNLLVPIWKRSKKHIPSFGWKSIPTFVGNSYTYKLGMDPWLAMGGNTMKYNYLIPFAPLSK